MCLVKENVVSPQTMAERRAKGQDRMRPQEIGERSRPTRKHYYRAAQTWKFAASLRCEVRPD
jgi:hypothetical protein